MVSMREWLLRLWGTIRRNPRNRDMQEELRAHLDLAREDALRNGSATEDAFRAARLKAGGVAQAMEAMRDQRGLPWLDDISRDVRHAFRSLRRSPVFSTVALLTLALAIGSNTTLFSIVNAVLLRPLPYQSPDRLAMLWTEDPSQNLREGRSACWDVELWRSQNQTFTDMAVFDGVSTTLTTADGAEQIGGGSISPNLLPLLGVQPVQGRIWTSEEAEQQQPLVLISHDFWQTRYGGSNDAVGATIVLGGRPFRIIGVLPAGFRIATFDADVFRMSQEWETRHSVRGGNMWFVVGRLRPTVTFERAQADMSALAGRLNDQLPAAQKNRGITVVPLSLFVVGPQLRLALWMLGGAVFCVFLIAAANVTSLSLVRSIGRAREMAVRAAVGAGAGRIARQLLTESVVLAALSGLIGTVLALVGIRLIRVFGPRDLPRLNEISLDFHVLGWALVISVLAGILVGVAPTIATLRRNLRSSAEEGGRSIAGGAAARTIRRALIVAEFALAIVLLVSAGLLIRSWWHVNSIDPGFRPERVLVMEITSPTSFNNAAQRTVLYHQVLEHIQAVPGVQNAGIIGDLLIDNNREQLFTVERLDGTISQRLRLRRDEVSADFFKAIGTPLLRGRFFSTADGPDAPRVAIINDAMARQSWPAQDPVGRRFKFGPHDSDTPWYTVVGVVGNMRRQGLEREAVPQMFDSLAQNPPRSVDVLIQTSSDDPLAMAGELRTAVRGVQKNVPIYGVAPLQQQFGAYLAQRRFQTWLMTGFSFVALLMAAIGIYGLIHYSVATRTREIAIRLAVGGRPGSIFRLIVREGLQLTVCGLLLGLIGALSVGRVGSSLLVGVTATDPLTFTTVSLLLIAVAAAACYFPARRAMNVEPIVALRHE
jgi:putative ABC transport system permease protein